MQGAHTGSETGFVETYNVNTGTGFVIRDGDILEAPDVTDETPRQHYPFTRHDPHLVNGVRVTFDLQTDGTAVNVYRLEK